MFEHVSVTRSISKTHKNLLISDIFLQWHDFARPLNCRHGFNCITKLNALTGDLGLWSLSSTLLNGREIAKMNQIFHQNHSSEKTQGTAPSRYASQSSEIPSMKTPFWRRLTSILIHRLLPRKIASFIFFSSANHPLLHHTNTLIDSCRDIATQHPLDRKHSNFVKHSP